MNDPLDAPAPADPDTLPEIPPIEDADAFEARVRPLITPPFKSKYNALTLDHLDDPGPEFEYIVDGWFSVGDRSVIGGPSKAGKSFLATHLGLCVAHGEPFFGAEVLKPGLVIYQAGEGARGVKKRLRGWRKRRGVSFSAATPFVLIQSPIDLYSKDGDTKGFTEEALGIARMFKDVALRMIIIDTLATATGGADENSGKDMSIVLQNLATISAATKAHVQFVHHMNASGEKLRGHTSIYANVDQIVLVKRNETTGVRTVRLDKQKDGEDGLTFQFELPQIEIGVSENGKPITTCICVPVGQRDAIRKAEEAKGFALNTDETIFMQAFFAAEKKHGLPVPPDMDIPERVRTVVPYSEVRRIYVETNPPSDLDPKPGETGAQAAERRRNTINRRLDKLRARLQQFSVIGARTRTGPAEGEDASIMWWTGKPLRAFPHTVPRPVVVAKESPEAVFGAEDDIGF